MNIPDLNDVRTFAVTSDAGAFSAAARDLGVTGINGKPLLVTA
jgi:hypothetical protein